MFDELKETIDINEMSDVKVDTKKKKFNEIDFLWERLSLYVDIKNAFNVINICYLIAVIKSFSYLYERHFSKHFHQTHHNYLHICMNVIFQSIFIKHIIIIFIFVWTSFFKAFSSDTS